MVAAVRGLLLVYPSRRQNPQDAAVNPPYAFFEPQVDRKPLLNRFLPLPAAFSHRAATPRFLAIVPRMPDPSRNFSFFLPVPRVFVVLFEEEKRIKGAPRPLNPAIRVCSASLAGEAPDPRQAITSKSQPDSHSRT